MIEKHKQKPKRSRLDQAMVARALAPDIDRARRLIMAGEVRVDGAICTIAGELVSESTQIDVREAPQYVSRGGIKLAHALDRSGVDAHGLTALDIGAGTGGFSDVLLQRGVAQLFAVDVGYGDVAWKVRSDPRVTLLERTNIRHLSQLPNGLLADLCVIDASFISLTLVLPAALRLLTASAQVIALVKPQFEAAREQVGEGGVVRDHSVHSEVLHHICTAVQQMGLAIAGVYASPITGPAGNVEFLLWLRRGGEAVTEAQIERMIHVALAEAPQ